MEYFVTDAELRDIKLQCLHLAARYSHCIHTLVGNAEELLMFVCGFERQCDTEPEINSDPESN